jgi:hypothetical protein
MMTLSRKHSHGMVEDITSTLYTLIQPRSSMALFIDWNRKSLATTVVDGINNSNIKLVRMLRQVMRT